NRMQIRHSPGNVKSDERLARIALLVDAEQVVGAGNAGRPEVDSFQNAAIERQELRREAEFALLEPGDLQYLRHMPVHQYRVRRKVLRYRGEDVLGRRLVPGPANTALGVTNDAGSAIHHASLHKRADREVRRGRIATWIREQPRRRNRRP